MKMRKCFGLVLVLALVIGSLGASATAAEPKAIESSGWFNTDISAGKVKKIGGEISLIAGESVNFNATYYSGSASVDFGVVDANNVFTYINITTGSVNAGVTVTSSGKYTPAIRNNSSDSISVSGIITTGLPSTN